MRAIVAGTCLLLAGCIGLWLTLWLMPEDPQAISMSEDKEASAAT